MLYHNIFGTEYFLNIFDASKKDGKLHLEFKRG
jgi:hypothetical protein